MSARQTLRRATPALRLVGIAAAGAALVLGAAQVDGSARPTVFAAPVSGETAPRGPLYQPLSATTRACVGPEARGLADAGIDELAMAVEVEAAQVPTQVRDELGLSDTPTTGGVQGAGSLLLEPVPQAADADVQPVESTSPGESVGLRLTEGQGVRVQGEGGAAVGLAGAQWHVSTEEFRRGLSAAPCLAAGTDAWLIAGGGQAGRLERLVLLNPSADPITVDVTVHGGLGALPSVGGQGIVVPGGGRVVQLVDAIEPGESAPVLHVRTSGGPVVALLGDRWLDGSNDRGLELTAPAAAPATDLVVPIVSGALVPSLTGQTLRIVAPGDQEAIVQLRALTADGPVRVANDVTRVPGGAVVEIDLSDVPPEAAAVQITSDEPVTAALFAQVHRIGEIAPDAGDDPDSDPAPGEDPDSDPAPGEDDTVVLGEIGEIAWFPATAALAEITGTPLPRDGQIDLENTLVLATASESAEVEVTTRDVDGQTATQVVSVGAAQTRELDLEAAEQVWLRVISGAPHAALLVTADREAAEAMLAGLPLADLPVSVAVLPVTPALP